MPCCFAHGGAGGGGYRGPPPPLILAPIIYQLVRHSCDPKLVAYVRGLVAAGPQAVAANAHKMVQYALSKVPAHVLYWFAAKVLNLPADAALQTTEFLKSRTEIEYDEGEQVPLRLSGGGGTSTTSMSCCATTSTSDIERRLERLEIDYQVLQEKHYESMRLMLAGNKPEDFHLPAELRGAEETTCAEKEEEESQMQLVRVDAQQQPLASESTSSSSSEGDGQALLLQDVGLRTLPPQS